MKSLQKLSLVALMTVSLANCTEEKKNLEETVQPEMDHSAELKESEKTFEEEALGPKDNYSPEPYGLKEPVVMEEGEDIASEGEKEIAKIEPDEESKQEEKSAEKMTWDPAEGSVKSNVQCSLKQDQRSVEVIEKDSGGCGVNYEKPGFFRQVAKADYDMSYCDKVSEKIQGNLLTAGFSCGGDTDGLAVEGLDTPDSTN